MLITRNMKDAILWVYIFNGYIKIHYYKTFTNYSNDYLFL